MVKGRKPRIPKLSYTDNRGLGFYVAYRDPITDTPKKHRIGNVSKEAAREAWRQWVANHLRGETPVNKKRAAAIPNEPKSEDPVPTNMVRGCLLEIATGKLKHDEQRVRKDDEPRQNGKIKRDEYESIERLAHDFLKFLNKQHGQGAVSRMRLDQLTMQDVEGYNLTLVAENYSDSQIRKRMQIVKAIIDRASRTEHGKQRWHENWDARDSYPGRPDKPVTLPTLKQLKLVLSQWSDPKNTALVWMAIGLAFGQSDLARARPLNFDKDDYDMRRGKTGIQRWGKMPKLVWICIDKYLKSNPRPNEELMFLTETGLPLVQGKSDRVVKWWTELRESLGEAGKGLNGFYSLRHLGATEFGSRPGCNLGDIQGFLGHGSGSLEFRKYMKPTSPENKEIVLWVRTALATGKVNLK